MKKHKIKISKFEVWLEPAAGGGYNVVVPVFPEIKAHGETLKEAKALAREAMELKLEALRANQEEHINMRQVIDHAQHYMSNNSQLRM